jgi:serine protease Do
VDGEGGHMAGVPVAPGDLRTSMPTVDEQRLRARIEQQTQLREALVGQPGTNLQLLEVDERIQTLQQELADLSAHHGRDAGRRTETAEPDGFTVRLVDGTEFHSLHAQVSDRIDLALFQLPADQCPHLSSADSTRLAQGERLYTIGNPSGLAYSVTSGIFSGDRGSGDERFLQTDAPINQGNSGGPLVTGDGRVVGVNTKVLSGTQGIGFAIPIEAVYRAFAALRRRADS